jgi:hypothetical protein
MMRALTWRTSISRQATARATATSQSAILDHIVLYSYKGQVLSGSHSVPVKRQYSKTKRQGDF